MKNLIFAAFVMLFASFATAQTAPAPAATTTTTTTAAPVKVKRTYKKRVKTAEATPSATTTAATTAPAQTAPATTAATTAPVKAKRVRKPKAAMTAPTTAASTTGVPTTSAPAPTAAKAPMAHSNSTYVPKAIGKDAKGRDILLGPNGGQYYIGSTGKKEYLRKDKKLKVS